MKVSLRDFALDVRRAFLPLQAALQFGLGPLVKWALRLSQKDQDYPVRIRIAIERMGLTYLKLGQYLAMRLDLVPAEVCRELGKLYESVSPMTFGEVKSVIESETGEPLTTLFSQFNPAPVAAASVAQVHEAVTLSNERVAVKVQRLGIEPVFASDMRNLRRLAAIADALGLFGRISLKEVVDEFAGWTMRELDFVSEGHTASRLRENATTNEVVPRIFWELTTRRMLTMEFVDGVSLIQIIALVEQGKEDIVQARLPGVDLDRAGHNMAYASLHQLFVSGFFHGDPHPGNIIIRSDSSVAFVDFGIFGELTPYQREVLARYIETLAIGDISESFGYLSRIATATEETDLQAFEKDAKSILHRWYDASRNPSSGYEDRSMGRYFGEILSAVRRHRLRMGTDTLLFWRALNALDYSALSMSLHFDLLHELRMFFKEIRPTPAERLKQIIADKHQAWEVSRLASSMSQYLNRILVDLSSGCSTSSIGVNVSGESRSIEVTAIKSLAAVILLLSSELAASAGNFRPGLRLLFLGVATILFYSSVRRVRAR